MTNSQRLALVRTALTRWLSRNEDEGIEATIERESILIRDGFFCGRRFQLGKFRAVWFIEEDQVKIYGADGSLVEVLESDHINGVAASEASVEPADETSPSIIKLSHQSTESDDGLEDRKAA